MSNTVPHRPMMVVGASPGETPKQVYAPYDRSVIATVDTTDRAAAEQALTTAYKLFRSRDSWLSKAERIAILSLTAAIMGEQV